MSRTLVNQISISDDRVQRLLSAMQRAFPDAEVVSYRALIHGLSVSPEDRHVLAAAIVAGADLIVTRNVRHFPLEGVVPFSIEVQSPDDFLVQILELYPDELCSIVAIRADDLGDSIPVTLNFLRQHVPRFVEKLESQGIS